MLNCAFLQFMPRATRKLCHVGPSAPTRPFRGWAGRDDNIDTARLHHDTQLGSFVSL